MFTPENPPQDYTRLQATLEQLLAAVPAGLPRPENRAGEFAALQQQAVQRCTIRQAVLGAQVRIPVHKALGRVCAMPRCPARPPSPLWSAARGSARRRWSFSHLRRGDGLGGETGKNLKKSGRICKILRL